MILYSYDPRKGKQVVGGEIRDGVFYKKVSPKHFMRIEQGYGISEDVIIQLKKLECKKIKIKSKVNSYLFDFEEILNKPVKNYGSGKQRFLRVRIK